MTSATQISQVRVQCMTIPNSITQPVAQVLFMIQLPPHSYLCLALWSQQLRLWQWWDGLLRFPEA